MQRRRIGMAIGLTLAATACASTPRQPPGQPPSAASVSAAEPGGDAHDPHAAALQRQLASTWGARRDKDDQLYVPLPDHEHWKRVRFWGIDHFVGFRYGKQAHVITAGFVQDVEPGEKLDSEHCLRRFDKWARPQLRAHDVKLGAVTTSEGSWRGHPLLIQSVDGHLDWGFSRRRFSVAWTAYPAYPTACLIYAVGVQWGEHSALAKDVRDRFVREAFQQINPTTAERPYRK